MNLAAADPQIAAPAADPQAAAFYSPQGLDVFQSVAHRHEIWKKDPYDVESIHAAARTAFQRLLHEATTPPGTTHGRILLIRGAAGSGKTHLMRVFRNDVHSQQLGYCGYMQMTSQSRDYSRYVLSNLIDSLDKPYNEPEIEHSGLMRLSTVLAEEPETISPAEIEALRNSDKFNKTNVLGEHVALLADRVLREPRFANLDVDLVRTLLFLQRDDARIKARALKYLRCEELPDYDWKVLGGVLSREKAYEPQRMIEQLGGLMSVVHHQENSLVLLVDQLEDMHHLQNSQECFRRAMDSIRQLTDNTPSSLVVISCLEDFYKELRAGLAGPILDRIESDPPPIDLTNKRSSEEHKAMVSLRLQHLYQKQGVELKEENPLFPFTEQEMLARNNLRARDVLRWCKEYRDGCMLAGRLIEKDDGGDTVDPPSIGPDTTKLEQRWNTFLNDFSANLSEDDELAELLSWSLRQASQELDYEVEFQADHDETTVQLAIIAGDEVIEKQRIGLCNRPAQGGGLMKQVKDLEKRAGEHIPIIVRNTEFPATRTSKINLEIGRLVKEKNARRVVAENSDWRAMLAFREFQSQHGGNANFAAWLREEKPLTQLKALQKILCLEKLPKKIRVIRPVAMDKPSPQPVDDLSQKTDPPPPSPAISPVELPPVELPPGQLRIGVSRSISAQPLTIPAQTLTRHAAFLGGTGSGKTTLALNLLEQLLEQNVPAVMVDRKGDLGRYACSQWWAEKLDDPAQQARKDRLREKIDVRLYTPGHPEGRPLAISLAPTNVQDMSSHERSMVMGYSAAALGAMLGYKGSANDQTRLVILQMALEVLSELSPGGVRLQQLSDLIHREDPALINAIGNLDTKSFSEIVNRLESLRLSRGHLFAEGAESLQTEALFSPTAAGKTPLTIISTKFLGDPATIDFWVSRLLVDINRWTSKHPADNLQGLLMLDEADAYLPATRKPATKEPMENLLKRARSAGLGLFLATQNPGDFDYKLRENINAWFVGRITQKTSISKMQEMLSSYQSNVGGKLSQQSIGEFFLLQAGAVGELKADRALMETQQMAEEEILKLAAR